MKKNDIQKQNALSNLLFPLLLVLIIGAIYMRTLLPGIGYMGDTAKFQFIGKVLGTPHAPGYPTYIILNHLFVTIFPFGTLAYKANLLSSIFTITAAIILYFTFQQIKVRPFISFLIVLTFSFGKTVWNQSIIAEVYTLNLLFLSLVTFFFLKWHFSRRDIHFYLGCLFYALSFGNHFIMISMLPALVYLVTITDKRTFISPKKILLVLFFICLGLSQYYYLYWRTISPDTTYLEIQVRNFRDLFFLLTGGESKDEIFQNVSAVQLFRKIIKFGFFFVREILILIPMPVIAFLNPRKKSIKMFFLIGFLGNLLVSFFYNIDDVWVYLIPSYFFLSCLIAMGFEDIFNTLSGVKKKYIAVLLFLLPLFFIGINFKRNDMSKDTGDKVYIETVLASIGQNAFIVNPGYDHYEYLKYYLLGEGMELANNIQTISMDEARVFLEADNSGEDENMSIYSLEIAQAQELENSGYCTEAIIPDLYLIQKCGGG